MVRQVIAALLVTAAFAPIAASAQEQQEMGTTDAKVTFGGQWQREREQQRQAARPERQPEQRQEARPERPVQQPQAARPERQPEQRARPEPAVQASTPFGARADGFAQPRPDQGRRSDGGQPNRFDQRGADDQRRFADQRRTDEDRRRADDGRRFADQRRGEDQRRADDDRRRADDQRRANDQRRSEGDRRRDDAVRRGDDDRRFNNGRSRDRGYDRPNNGAFGRGDFNRGWRDDHRYDWNRYRTTNRNLFRLPRYSAPYGWSYGYRHYGVGAFLSDLLWSQDYWLDDPYSYRLPPVEWPYRWVRYYDDALLVDTSTGYVVDAVYGIFD